MALNFPDSPSLNQVYTDTTSGFSYQWDGVVWKSYAPASSSQIRIIDDISGSFNGSAQTFALTSTGTAIIPVNAQQLRVVLGGIVQEPVTDYTVSGSNITFTTPPTGGLDCSIVSLGPAVPVNTIDDGTVTPPKLSTGGPTWNTSGDVYISGIASVGTAITMYASSGIVSATAFYGDGANLSNTGSTLGAASGSQRLVVTSQTSGTMTSVGTDADLSWDSTTNTLSATNVSISGIASVGTAITMYASSGIVSATAFYGDGANLSNTGSTLSAASGTERLVFTNLTTGTMTASSTDANVTYNATTNTLSAPNVSIAGTLTSGDVSISGIASVGTAITMYASSGIVSATAYYGDGSNLTGVGGISTTGITTGYILSNPNFIGQDITLNNPNHNYGMFGPITINPGVTVTVGVGNTFTII